MCVVLVMVLMCVVWCVMLVCAGPTFQPDRMSGDRPEALAHAYAPTSLCTNRVSVRVRVRVRVSQHDNDEQCI